MKTLWNGGEIATHKEPKVAQAKTGSAGLIHWVR